MFLPMTPIYSKGAADCSYSNSPRHTQSFLFVGIDTSTVERRDEKKIQSFKKVRTRQMIDGEIIQRIMTSRWTG